MQFVKRASAIAITALLSAGGLVRAQSASPGKAPGGATDVTGVTRATPVTLPATIPIFPLEPTMLFPGVSRPLYIFEPRYRAMMADALKGDRIIGMTTFKPGFEANYQGRPEIYPIGCAGEIIQAEELSGGRYNIVVRGLVKIRVTGEDETRPYRLARVEALPEVATAADKAALHEQRARLEALVTKGGDSKVPPDMTDEGLVNMLAQYVPMSLADRQRLLELDSLLSRAEALIALLERKH
jgi:Lon protease-like protein